MRNPERTAKERRAADGEIVRPDTIVVTSGRYGSCEQYVNWLIDATGCDAIKYDRRNFGYISLYKSIIFMGPIRDAVIKKVSLLWQNYHNFNLEDKNLIVCGVGLGDPDNKEYFDKVMRRSGSDQGFSTNFILPGAIDRDELTMLDRAQFDKFLVDAGRIYGEKTATLINERASENYDGVQRMNLEPIIKLLGQ